MMKALIFILFGIMLNSFFANAQNIDYQKFLQKEKQSLNQKMHFKTNNNTTGFDIVYHRVYWEVDPSERYIKGSVTTYFVTLTNALMAIHFDMIDALKADSVIYHGSKTAISHQNDILKINLPLCLASGTLDSVTVFYKGVPPVTEGFGSFETNYHNNTPVLWTLSEPYGAKEWWPCKQTLTDKIDSIDIFVKTPTIYKVASNGKLVYEKITGDNKITYWKHRYPIAPYLVGIAVTNYASFSDFANVNLGDTKVEIVNYVYPENESWLKPMAKYTIDALELYSSVLAPYPFYKEKYGHAQFGWSGGMEHQTMSFMYNLDPDLIAHELSHQWFGDYVTCSNWHDIWVNEGFAVFCESLCQEFLHPDNYLQWKYNWIDYVLSNARFGSVYVDDTTNVDRIFNYELTYQKGGLIIHQLRHQIGDEAFFAGIKNLLNKGGFASANDVKGFFEAAADTNLTTYFNNWYYGKGFPKYSISWNQDNSNLVTFTIKQTTTSTSVPFYSMKIPLQFKSADSQTKAVFHNTQNNQLFSFNPGFRITEMVFDPEYTIIAPHPATFILDIASEESDKDVSLSPNPANDLLTIKAIKNTQLIHIEIIDGSGKVLIQEKCPQQTKKTHINTGVFPTGVYYVRLETNKGFVTKKLAIKR